MSTYNSNLLWKSSRKTPPITITMYINISKHILWAKCRFCTPESISFNNHTMNVY